MMEITIPVGEIGATRGLQIRFIWIKHWERSNRVECICASEKGLMGDVYLRKFLRIILEIWKDLGSAFLKRCVYLIC
jgi:hypothetical protein